jgi:hypothetical protein
MNIEPILNELIEDLLLIDNEIVDWCRTFDKAKVHPTAEIIAAFFVRLNIWQDRYTAYLPVLSKNITDDQRERVLDILKRVMDRMEDTSRGGLLLDYIEEDPKFKTPNNNDDADD